MPSYHAPAGAQWDQAKAPQQRNQSVRSRVLESRGRSDPDGEQAPASGKVGFDAFAGLMEGALAANRGMPRAYLVPTSSIKPQAEEPAFRPAIDPRSRVGH